LLRLVAAEITHLVPADTDISTAPALVPVLCAFAGGDLHDSPSFPRVGPPIEEPHDLSRMPAVEAGLSICHRTQVTVERRCRALALFATEESNEMADVRRRVNREEFAREVRMKRLCQESRRTLQDRNVL